MTRSIFEDDDILTLDFNIEFAELKHVVSALTSQKIALRNAKNPANASFVDQRVEAITSFIEQIIAQTGEHPAMFSPVKSNPKVPDNVVIFKRH